MNDADDDTDQDADGTGAGVRLDKWLWAARFFRTRAKAKEAIVSGRVQIDGARSKPARVVAVGMEISVRRGDETISVTLTRLDDERKSAPLAQTLYAETEQSRERRAREAELRAASPRMHSHSRPTKRDRRAFDRLRDAPAGNHEDDA